MDKDDYRRLMRLALQGDSEALGTILWAFRPPVANTCYLYLVRFSMQRHTEDLVQDVYCAAVQGFPRYDPVGSFIHYWLKTIAINQCIKWTQRNRIFLLEKPIEPIEDAEGDIVRAAPVEVVTANVWAADSIADHGRPPLQTPQSDPAKMRKSRPDRAQTGKRGGHPPQPIPDHVLRNRELYAAL
jgi:hypothetical protein